VGPIGCPETSVGNYHYSLRNNPEERSSHKHKYTVITSTDNNRVSYLSGGASDFYPEDWI
jgi:hypothetical protein